MDALSIWTDNASSSIKTAIQGQQNIFPGVRGRRLQVLLLACKASWEYERNSQKIGN